MIKAFFSILLLVVSLTRAAVAADGPELPLGDFPSSMSFNRFTEDLSTSSHRIYFKNGLGYFPTNGDYINASRGSCLSERLHEAVGIRREQEFSFEVMKQRLGYTEDKKWAETENSLFLHPDQLVVLKSSRLVPKRLYHGPTGPEAVEDISHDDSNYRVVTAAMWTVSGQIYTHTEPFVIFKDMPWMNGTRFHDFAAAFRAYRSGDRSALTNLPDDVKGIRTWSEWGRGAQKKGMSGEIDPLYASAAATDYQRVVAAGGKVEDAGVIIDCDLENTTNLRLYRSWFKEYEVYPGLFMVPLKKVLEKWPPREYVHRVAAVIKLSNGKLTDTQALDLFNEHKLLIWDEVNFKTPSGADQGQPLLIHDFSLSAVDRDGVPLGSIFDDQIFQRYGIPPENRATLETYLAQIPHNVGKFNLPNVDGSPAYEDSHGASFIPELIDMHAVEISNLNGKMTNDPNYVKGALLSSYAFYIKKFFGGKPLTNEKIQAFLLLLHHSKVHFAITTGDPNIASQAAALKPSQTFDRPVITGVDLSAISQFPPPSYIRETVKNGHSYMFTIEDMTRLIDSDPNFFNTYCQNGVQAGTFRTNHLINSNDHY